MSKYEYDDEVPEQWDGDSDGDSRCPYCCGEMEWCSICQMWTSTCCEEYGTCQCS